MIQAEAAVGSDRLRGDWSGSEKEPKKDVEIVVDLLLLCRVASDLRRR